ncbi:PorT family protein [Saprospiraceae bacterium]|nr:PorT family protein [Saprospiraceae bacterium]MDC1305373.1 PorT family protein [Saprospiraceae bacterium]
MNELDKIFRSKLENQTAEYSEQSWDKIQSRLMKQKSKPRNFLWLWTSLVAVIVVGAIYLWSNVDDIKSDFIQGNSNPMVVNTDSHNQSIGTGSTKGNYTMTTQPNELGADNSIDVFEEDLSHLTTYATFNHQVSTGSRNESKTIAREQNLNLNNSGIQQGINDGESNNIISVNSNVLSTKSSGRSVGGAVENQELSIISEKIEVLNEMQSNEANNVINTRPLRTIGFSVYSALQSEMKITDITLSMSMMDDFRQDCPSFVTDRTGVYLDFYLSHELPFSTLKAKVEELEPYGTLRSNSEGPTYSFSAGVRLTLMLPNGLGLKTGLNYSQVNERFTYVDYDSDMVKEVITITTVDGMEVRDTNIIIIPGTRDVVSTNKYRSFDIPLLLSYEWDVRERTYMTMNGGIYLNLLFKESGKILSPSGEVIDLADSSGDKLVIFKNNIGLSLFGSVGLHYRMNSNIDLILEPNIRLLVKSATVDAYSLEHKWMTIGLITGLRYNF